MVAGLPITTVAGFKLVSSGAGLLIGKFNWFDTPPPGAGLTTVMVAAPAFARSAATTLIVSWVAETKVVARSAPLNFTCAPFTKFVPAIVKVKSAPPAVAVAGVKLVRLGVGLLTVKFASGEVPPPGSGVKTVNFKTLAFSTSFAVKFAFNSLVETNVVGRSLPFTFTIEAVRKFVPVTVTTIAPPPATTALGANVNAPGTGLLIGKLTVFDVPPPGAGLTTVTVALPVAAISAAATAIVN